MDLLLSEIFKPVICSDIKFSLLLKEKIYSYNLNYTFIINYPRGRVEIKNGTAVVYHSPHIPQNELKKWLIEKFNLTTSNGIRKIRLFADGSEHYRCYLDY